MAFETNCPECKAKLRLGEAPASGTPIECPRCGSLFVPPKAKASEADKSSKSSTSAAKKDKKPGMPKKRKVKKKKTNPVLLVMAIAFGFAALIGVGALLIYFANRAGKVEEMLSFVPSECNNIRGVNVSQLAKYPGYSTEVTRFIGGAPMDGASEVAKAADIDPGRFVDYFIIARSKPDRGATGTIYIFRTTKKINGSVVGSKLSGATPSGDGFKMGNGAAGILAGAYVYFPKSGRHVVVVARGGNQENLNRGTAGAISDPKSSFTGTNIDATCRVAMRGSIWLVIKNTAGLKNYTGSLLVPVNQDFKALADAGAKSKTFGLWSTPGGSGVRFGAGMECENSKEASSMVSNMKSGPLGKGDDSEPTNQLRTAWSGSTDKRMFSEVMQFMEYRAKSECAYFVTTATDERAKSLMNLFNNPLLGTGDTGGAPSTGFPSGASGGPSGGPPGRGLPGGIANPGGP